MANKRLFRKTALIMSIVIIGLVIFLNVRTDYTQAIRLNWGVKVPRGYEITFNADSGPSPFGDGDRYNVLYYKNGIKQSFLEDFTHGSNHEIEEEVQAILARLEISPEQSIDFNQPYVWKKLDSIPDGGPGIATKAIYFIYQPNTNTLYIVNFKI